MTTTLHAHVSTASSDCDGPMYREYVSIMNGDERKSDFPDLEFKARILSNHVSFHSEAGVQARIFDGGFETQEQTDEGYRSADVRWCEDECDEAEAWQRDVFAEQMGY